MRERKKRGGAAENRISPRGIPTPAEFPKKLELSNSAAIRIKAVRVKRFGYRTVHAGLAITISAISPVFWWLVQQKSWLETEIDRIDHNEAIRRSHDRA